MVMLSYASYDEDTLLVKNCKKATYYAQIDDDFCDWVEDDPELNALPEDQQKTYMISQLMGVDRTVIDEHEFVELWNKGIIVDTDFPSELSDEAKELRYETIGNVWTALIGVIPSYMENGTLYTLKEGDAVAVAHYDLFPPKNFAESRSTTALYCGGGSTNSDRYGRGDCKTIYHDFSHEADLRIYQGESELVGEVSDKQELNLYGHFERFGTNYWSKLKVRHTFYADHYKWKKAGCCKACKCEEPPCGCCTYYYRCSLSQSGRNNKINHILHLKHDYDQNIKQYQKPNFSHKITLYDEQTKPVVKVETDADDYEIRFLNGAKFMHFSSDYFTGWWLAPYNALYTTRTVNENYYASPDVRVISTNNVTFETDPANIGSCTFTYYYRFNKPGFDSETVPCEIVRKLSPKMTIATDKGVYKEEEVITLRINVSENDCGITGYVTANYDNISKQVPVYNGYGESKFIAKKNSNFITVNYSGELSIARSKNIKVLDKNFINIVYTLVFFCFFSMVIIRLYIVKIKRMWLSR